MSGKGEWLFRIHDMIDAIEEMDTHLSAISAEIFYADSFLQKGMERYFEIIGEAARFIPKDIQDRHPEIDWKNIIGMRHKIAHDYLDVDMYVLWKSYRDDIPRLKAQLMTLALDYE